MQVVLLLWPLNALHVGHMFCVFVSTDDEAGCRCRWGDIEAACQSGTRVQAGPHCDGHTGAQVPTHCGRVRGLWSPGQVRRRPSWDSHEGGPRLGAFCTAPTFHKLFTRTLNTQLETAVTWQRELSAKGNKAKVWKGLVKSKKLPFMAMLRNLRNMILSGASTEVPCKIPHHT